MTNALTPVPAVQSRIVDPLTFFKKPDRIERVRLLALHAKGHADFVLERRSGVRRATPCCFARTSKLSDGRCYARFSFLIQRDSARIQGCLNAHSPEMRVRILQGRRVDRIVGIRRPKGRKRGLILFCVPLRRNHGCQLDRALMNWKICREAASERPLFATAGPQRICRRIIGRISWFAYSCSTEDAGVLRHAGAFKLE